MGRSAATTGLAVGVAHHLGWANLVTADDRHRVVDRRRVELIEPGLPAAPIHHEGGTHELHRSGDELDDAALGELVARVRASAEHMTEAALDALAQDLTAPVTHLCLRAWRDDLPTDMAALRRPPHESRADSVMYLEVLAAAADRRGWQVHTFDAKTVEAAAAQALGPSADLEAVLAAPRTELGPPWSKEHRMALAATIVVNAGG